MMKTIIIFFIIFSTFAVSFAEDLSENVIVSSLTESLPSSESKLEDYLWKDLPDIPSTELFRSVTTENWQDKFAIYSNSLVKKAKALNLDSEFLNKSLSAVKKHSKDEIAYLPVAAYFSDINGNPVCVIVVKWEFPEPIKDDNGKIVFLSLSHKRMFVYNKNLELVGFSTCM